MMFFHIANRCRGIGILDDLMRHQKNAYFYLLDVSPFWDKQILLPLYCLPKGVVAICIRQPIDDYCGATTADLVQHYILYMQDW